MTTIVDLKSVRWQRVNHTINTLRKWKEARARKSLDVRALDDAIEISLAYLHTLGFVKKDNAAGRVAPMMSLGWMEAVRVDIRDAVANGHIRTACLETMDRLIIEAEATHTFALNYNPHPEAAS